MKPSLANPEGVEPAMLKLLKRELKPLDKVEKGLADRCLRYVVDDADAEALLVLAGGEQGAQELRLASNDYQYYAKHSKQIAAGALARSEMFQMLDRTPGGVFYRLCEVYAACKRGVGASPNLSPYRSSGPQWPDWLLAGVIELVNTLSGLHYGGVTGSSENQQIRFEIACLEKALAASEEPTGLVLETALSAESYQIFPRVGYGAYVDPLDGFIGWKHYAERHVEVVREVITAAKADIKVQALGRLRQMSFDFRLVVNELVALATGTAKTVRESAGAVLRDAAIEGARPLIEAVLSNGTAAERNEAAALMWRLYEEDAEPVLRAHAEQEKSSRVVQTIERLTAAPLVDGQTEEENKVELPPLALDEMPAPLPEAACQGIAEFLQQDFEAACRRYERDLEAWNDTAKRQRWMRKPKKPTHLGEKGLKSLLEFVEGKTDKVKPLELDLDSYNRGFGDYLAPPQVSLEHVARLLVAVERMQVGTHHEFWYHDQRDLEAYRERGGRAFGLREFDAVVAKLPRGKPGLVAQAYLASSSWHSFCDWEPEAIWPLFYEQVDLLRAYFGPSPNAGRIDYQNYDYYWNEKRSKAFQVLAMFPALPALFIAPLWELALGESKTIRPLAQQALHTVPDKSEKIIVALGDGKQAVRGSAAEWLGKLGDPAAIEPLRKAYKKEKQELVKGQLLNALEALGHDISEFFNRAQLARDAEKGLAKKMPKGMEWVPLDSLPPLHWEKTGKRVAPEIVKWWVIQSIQHKSPTPGPLLRRYLEMCRRDETRELAQLLLQLWVTADTRAMPYEEAAERAKQESDQLWSQYGSGNGWAKQHYKTKDNLYRERVTMYAEACLGSAIGQKGLLAIVAAAGDSDCAKIAEQYIRKWYGQRAAQCKALLEVLSWIEDPAAVQVLLSIATRFRTKSIRKAAEDLVNVLAERQGWTLDQLADRTLPDAGFARELDEDGVPVGHEAVLDLDYGPRKFRVTLDDELKPVITREDGKTVKALPSPAKDDDEELAKAAKKALSQSKKTLKETVKRLRERLYESLCTQRVWSADEWRTYLADHPIASKLCGRIVWVASDSDSDDAGSLGCFRPLEDGSLTDEQDNEFDLPAGAVLRIAHACNTAADVGKAWEQHLADYDVEPLFTQFGRSVYSLPEDRKKATDLDDFKGHCLTTFQLRGKATKAGFVRGEAEDGGSFFVYRKQFPSLSLEAVLEFTGSYLPEDDVPAALTTLYFVKTRKDGNSESSWNPNKVPLGKVPAVLLSECRNDVEQIAAAGTGFDPEWEKKSHF